MSEQRKPPSAGAVDYGSHFGNIRTVSELLRDPNERTWLTTMPREPEEHQYVVWLGCSITRTAHIADTLSDVLRYLGTDFVSLGGPSNCCGIVHSAGGDKAVADNLLRQTVRKFDAFKPQQMLNWCPSCNTELRRMPDAEMTEIARGRASVTSHLKDSINRFEFKNPVPLKVAIHSHGGTPDEDGDGDAVRTILARIPDLTFVETPPVTLFQHHCSDQNLRKHGQDIYLKNLKEWITAAKSAGASHIVTIYHSCHRQILRLQRELPSEQQINVVNYLTLIARSLDLPEREDMFAQFAQSADVEAIMAELGPRISKHGIDPDRARKAVVAHFAKS